MSTTLVVPSEVGSGTGVSVSAYGKGRTLIRAGGADDDVIRIHASMDDSGYAELFEMKGASWVKHAAEDQSHYYQANLVSGTGGGSVKVNGPPAVDADDDEVNKHPLEGTAVTTDATATEIVSFTSVQDGGYVVKGTLIGMEDDETTYAAEIIAAFKSAGGTLSAIGITPIAEITSDLDPGTHTATVTGSTAKINVVGIVGTNINWSFKGYYLIEPAF